MVWQGANFINRPGTGGQGIAFRCILLTILYLQYPMLAARYIVLVALPYAFYKVIIYPELNRWSL